MLLCAWALQGFVDGNYASAWWSLLSVAGEDLPLETSLTVGEAIGLLGSAAACVAVSFYMAMTVARCDASMIVALGAATWLLSPWHIPVLQTGGARAYLALMAAMLLAAVFLRVMRRRPVVVAAAWLASVLVALLVQGGAALGVGLPHAIVPPLSSVLPWDLTYGFNPEPQLYLLWLLLLAVVLAASVIREKLPKSSKPLLVVWSIATLLSVFSLSETVEVRAQPRLALFYSYDKGSENPLVQWLAYEYFAAYEGANTLALPALTGMPQGLEDAPSYAFVMACLSRVSIDHAKSDPFEIELLREYLRRNSRCGDRSAAIK